MNNKSILVTGGCGFIGSNLVRELRRRYFDHEIVVVDKMTYAANFKNLEDVEYQFYKYDIRSENNMRQLFKDYSFKYVFHLAAESHVDKSISGPELFFQTNVLGTQNLLQSILDSGNIPERIINVSTDEVYGHIKFGSERKFEYNDTLAPTSPYAASKTAQDMVAMSYHKTYGLPIVTTRCSNNYGPRQDKTKLIPKAIKSITHGEKFPVYNGGINERDWLWVYDHVDGLIKAAECGNNGKVYLFGTGKSRPNHEVTDTLAELIGKEFYADHVEDRKAHDEIYRCDYNYAEKELGWSPTTDFNTGIKKTVAWYLENKWCLE